MVISHIEPLFTQARLEAFIGLSMLVTCTKPWFYAHGFTYEMHKPWAWKHGFLHTVIYGNNRQWFGLNQTKP